MSFFASPVMVRLQELKLWQGNYDSLLQNRSKDGTNPSDYETIEGLSALDSIPSSPLSSPERYKEVDWDKKTISPSKTFSQLLEEKLAEDKPIPIKAVPKRPFLRKGAGLTRYQQNNRAQSARTPKRPTTQPLSGERMRKSERSTRQCSSAPIKRKSCLKTENFRREPEVDITPLKMPDLSIRPKASWHKVLEENQEISGGTVDKKQAEAAKRRDDFKAPKNNFNSHIMGKINEFALKHFLPHSTKKSAVSKNSNNFVNASESTHNTSRDKTLCEGSTENELRIFEALEERVENSSFSSTNSSIIRLLSSTPSKVKKPSRKSPIEEEKYFLAENHRENGHVEAHAINLQQKLQEVNKKSDVLHDFLKNLRRMGSSSNAKRRSSESLESDAGKSSKRTPETSFDDEEKWSSNTDTRSPTPLSFYNDFEAACKGVASIRTDAAVNTSFADKEDTTIHEKCPKCAQLEKTVEELHRALPDVKAEKARVCDFAKELEKKRDQIAVEMHKLRKDYEDELQELREELEAEKKKFAREKTVFDMYLKDSQNRPTRKEREEISNLKKELVDLKELLKLKETKSGATQARLRNQIKQLEKDNAELRVDLEKLQKENGKLSASQKVRRPSEAKMLLEINKNLTKLTEETFKKQAAKSEGNGDEITPKSGRKSRDKENDDKEKETGSKVKQAHSSKTKVLEDVNLHNAINETCGHDSTSFANLSIEKQYENVFGQFPSPRATNSSLNDSKKEKTETVFEDGSKEVRYSNGNTKTISPDRNLIIVRYYNGDVKETNLIDKTLKYYYAENATWHTQFGDGTELLEYANGQTERKYKNGKSEIRCADGSFVTKLPDGSEEILYPDGSKLLKTLTGDRVLFLPNGQKEIHTKEHKRREYPDGTVKILYPDGSQETRYASGRVRIKDSQGALIMDTQNSD